jgi:hypothetical protein
MTGSIAGLRYSLLAATAGFFDQPHPAMIAMQDTRRQGNEFQV